MYGSTTKGDVVKRSDCILVYRSTTKGDVVKRSDCILVYGSTTKGGVINKDISLYNVIRMYTMSARFYISCLYGTKNVYIHRVCSNLEL